MGTNVSIDQVTRLAPGIRPAYSAAFGRGQAVLDRYGISATPLRVAHFMAQTLYESGAYTLLYENLDYSAARLAVVWPSRFRRGGPLDPALYAHRPQQLANAVYGGRLGNVAPEDGHTFRGRGLLQLTGRSNYAAATTLVRRRQPEAPDFTLEPDLVSGADWCLQVAVAGWNAKGCNAPADADDVRGVTLLINGGVLGLAERLAWTRRTRLVWCVDAAGAPPG